MLAGLVKWEKCRLDNRAWLPSYHSHLLCWIHSNPSSVHWLPTWAVEHVLRNEATLKRSPIFLQRISKFRDSSFPATWLRHRKSAQAFSSGEAKSSYAGMHKVLITKPKMVKAIAHPIDQEILGDALRKSRIANLVSLGYVFMTASPRNAPSRRWNLLAAELLCGLVGATSPPCRFLFPASEWYLPFSFAYIPMLAVIICSSFISWQNM